MSIEHLEILVEEPSMEAFLINALPNLLPQHVTFSVYSHNGKHDLLKKLPNRIEGYSKWIPNNYGIVVLVDCDSDIREELKERLEDSFYRSGIPTKTTSNGLQFAGLTRIAIEELEAWYFGNWTAVRRAYPELPPSVPQRAAFRDSDAISGGTWEAFEKICKKNGIFRTGLRKVEAARNIGQRIEVTENRSQSF